MISKAFCVGRSQLRKVKVQKPPAAGPAWRGVPHAALMGEVIKAAAQKGIQAFGELRLHLERGGADMACSIPLSHAGPLGFTPHLGIITSNAMKQGLTFYAGAVEDETGTPVVVDRLTGGTRKEWMYTKNFDIQAVCQEAIRWWDEAVYKVGVVTAIIQSREIWDAEVPQLLYSAGREDVIPWSYIGQVDGEWHTDGRLRGNGWILARAGAAAVGKSSPMKQMPRLLRFYQMLAGLHTTHPELEIPSGN
jgi:hypothetical protein